MMRVEDGLGMMRAAGLQLQAAFAVGELPDWALQSLQAGGHDPAGYRTLVMFGHGGTRLWEHIVATGKTMADPFDDTSRRLAGRFVADYLDGSRFEIVYPGPALLPLGRLAELAGWGRPSPLGLTINPEFGLWMAHRVVLLVDAHVEVARRHGAHPCHSCVDKPCIAACPVGAVDAESGFDVSVCTQHRLASESPCALQCLARNACPIGSEHRYGPDQMSHHYGASLRTIRDYYESEAS